MGSVTVIGEPEQIAGYALAGAVVVPAVGAGEVLRAWAALAPDTSLVILTAAAAEFLDLEPMSAGPLVAVMPK